MRRLSIGAQLGILTGALGLLALLFAVVTGATFLRLVDRRAHESARTLARTSVLALDHLLGDGEEGLRSLALRSESPSGEAACQERLARALTTSPIFLDFLEVGPEGRIRCSGRAVEYAGEAGPLPPDLESRLEGEGELVAFPPVRIGEEERWVVPLSLAGRRTSDGEPGGTVIGLVTVERLQELLGRIPLPEQGIVTVIEISTGRIMARSVDPEAWVGRTIESEMVTSDEARQGGSVRVESLDDVDRVWGFEPTDRLDWAVNVGLPVEWIRGPVWDAVGVSTLLVLTLFFFAILLADRTRRAIVGTVQVLVDQSRAAAEGGGRRIEVEGPREIEELAETFNRTLRDRASLDARLRQAEKLRSVGRLAGGIAHEFRNLLTVITGEASLLSASAPGDEEVRGSVARIESAAERASALTRKLLAVGERAPERVQEVALAQTLRKELRLAALALDDAHTLEAEIEEDLPAVRCGPGALATIVRELVDNARHAMPEGGKIRVTARRASRSDRRTESDAGRDRGGSGTSRNAYGAVLEVEDRGEGIEPGIREQVYEPFFTTREGATGLGLSTVRGLVRQTGGRTELRSRPGHGTRVLIFFRYA